MTYNTFGGTLNPTLLPIFNVHIVNFAEVIMFFRSLHVCFTKCYGEIFVNEGLGLGTKQSIIFW